MSQDWYKVADMAKRLGCTCGAVRKRGARGIQLQRKSIGGVWWYKEVAPEPEPVSLAPVETDTYSYDPISDEYMIPLSSGITKIDGEKVRSLWRDITAKVPAVVLLRKYSLDQPTYLEIKRRLSVGHNSPSFTPEEFGFFSDVELIEDVAKAREHQILARGESLAHRRMEKFAANWVHFKSAILDQIREVGISWPKPESYELKYLYEPEVSNHVCILGTSDFHVGKRPFGQDGSGEGYIELLKRFLIRAIEDSSTWGIPERYVIIIGSDLLHVDNLQYATTRGTPQGGQMVGSVYQAFNHALALMAWLIDTLRHRSKVQGIWVPGNHDTLLSYTVAAALQERYRSTENVEICLGEHSRKTYTYWDVPVMFTHGHHLPRSEYVTALAMEMDRGAILQKGVVIEGHYHQAKRKQDHQSKVQIVTLASPAPPDDWHHDKGYDMMGESHQKLSVLKIEKGRGLTSIHLAGL